MPDLKAATDRLAARVDELNHNLAVSAAQAKRTKILIRCTLVIAGLAVLGVIATGITASQAHDATQANKHSQVVNCQNNNDSRAATLTLWQFIIDQSHAKSPQQKVALQKIDVWIQELYAPRDCSDLSQKVTIPPPPNVNLG